MNTVRAILVSATVLCCCFVEGRQDALANTNGDAAKNTLPTRFKKDVGSTEFFTYADKVNSGAKESMRIPSGAADFDVEKPRATGGKTVDAADFGLSESREDCGEILNAAIAHCKKIGAEKLTLKKGVYKCFDKREIFLENLSDFTFDGNGATLVFRRYTDFENPDLSKLKDQSNIVIKNCERVKLENFKIDWDWATDPIGAFVEVVAKNVSEKDNESSFDLKFAGYEKYPLYKKPTPVIVITPMNADCEKFSPRSNSLYFGTYEGHYGTKCEWIAPDTARIYPFVKPENLPCLERYNPEYSAKRNRICCSKINIGNTFRLAHYYYGKNGITMSANRNISLENIDIYSCRGMGIILRDAQKFTELKRVKIAPPPDAFPKRPYSSTADAVSVVNTAGFVKLEECSVSLNQDDICNFHDNAGFARKSGDKKLSFINDGGVGYLSLKVGDELELCRPDYTPLNFRSKVAEVKGNAVILADPIPHTPDSKYVVLKTAFSTKNIILKNCVFKNFAGRGIFQSSDITIDGCTFENAIRSPLRFQRAFSIRQWMEGYGCKNVVVKNCVFKNSMCTQKLYGCVHDIFIGSRRPDSESNVNKSETARDILIENNKFENVLGFAVYAFHAENAIFRNNLIKVNKNAPYTQKYAGSSMFENVDGAVADGNKIVSNSDATNGVFVCTTPKSTEQRSKTPTQK